MSKFDRAVQVSEVIGAAAIVISLIYVGSEVRQNTLSVQTASHQSSIAMAQDLDQHFFDAEFAAVYDAALTDHASLDGIEKRQFETHAGKLA